MRRTLAPLTLTLLGSCVPWFHSNIGWTEMERDYRARFFAEGNTLVVRLWNEGGLNVSELKAFPIDGVLFLGGTRVSSGPPGWQWLQLDVTPYGLGTHWHEGVFWCSAAPDSDAVSLRELDLWHHRPALSTNAPRLRRRDTCEKVTVLLADPPNPQ